MKQIVANNVSVPDSNKLRNLKLLIKNLKDDINERISQTDSEPNNFPAYKSHRLLMKMEEKETRYKQMKRMKELSFKIKRTNRRNSDVTPEYHSLSTARIQDQSESQLHKVSSTLESSMFEIMGK